MKNKNFLFLIIIFTAVTFLSIIQYNVFISTIHPNIWQAIMLFVMFIAIAIQFQQLWEVEDSKVLVAVTSLIEEMEYNKILIDGYIQHSDIGANVTPVNGFISWEWNKPRFGSYERYLITACKSNLSLAKNITILYNKLEACKVIIETVQNFVANNLISMRGFRDGDSFFITEISKNNKQLSDISKEIRDLIPDLIEKLKGKGGSGMNFTKNIVSVCFLLLWLIFYLLVYLFSNKNPLSIIPVYIIFTIVMYVVDIKFSKWGLIHKIFMKEPAKEDVSASVSSSSFATFAAIAMALLTFTVGYAVKNPSKIDWNLKVSAVLILISTISYLFTLEAKETSLKYNWEKKERERFNLFIMFLQIIGWHSLFLYTLLVISFIGNQFFFVSITIYTIILFYYYCLVD
jgi:hypothetical protein